MAPLEGAGIPDPLLDFSVWSLRQHQPLAAELQEASGVDNQFQVGETLKLAFDETSVLEYKERLKWQSQVDGFRVQWLSPEEVARVEPMANPDNLGAVHVQGGASVEPYRYTLSASQAGERAGVEILLRRATGLISEADHCLGVTFEGGRLEAGTVVLAMGPWSGEASSWCRFNMPVSPLKGQILRLQHTGAPIKTSLYWERQLRSHQTGRAGLGRYHRRRGRVRRAADNASPRQDHGGPAQDGAVTVGRPVGPPDSLPPSFIGGRPAHSG